MWQTFLKIAQYLDKKGQILEAVGSPDINKICTFLIEPKTHSILLILFLAATRLKAKKIRQAAFASLSLYPLIFGIKLFVGRSRPYLNEDIFSFHPLSFQEIHSSFPSSHAAALGLFLSIFRPKFWPLLVPLALVRVVEKMHYPSDIFAGLLLGFFLPKLTNAALSYFEKKAPLKWFLKDSKEPMSEKKTV